ncbi:MAG: hypothetical protein ACLRWQ_15660 [Flavonifractor plautii]
MNRGENTGAKPTGSRIGLAARGGAAEILEALLEGMEIHSA